VEINGSGPQNLEKLRDMLPGMKRQRQIRKHHRPGSRAVSYKKVPRQVCQICWALFDYAIGPASTEPTLSICTECKGRLAEGYTALITIGGQHRFVKSSALNAAVKGQVRVVKDEDLESLVNKFEKHDSSGNNGSGSPETKPA
jgi:hypothetical protein